MLGISVQLYGALARFPAHRPAAPTPTLTVISYLQNCRSRQMPADVMSAQAACILVCRAVALYRQE